jgi:hypothetical protein
MNKFVLLFLVFIVSISSIYPQQKDSVPARDSYYEGLLGFRLGAGSPQGEFDKVYNTMPGLNIMYQIRFTRNIYAGLSTFLSPDFALSDVPGAKTGGCFCFFVNGRYAFHFDRDINSIYLETGLGLYRTRAAIPSLPFLPIKYESKSNFGLNIGIGYDGHISKNTLIDLNVLYHNFYDSRDGGNAYGFITILAGVKFVISY